MSTVDVTVAYRKDPAVQEHAYLPQMSHLSVVRLDTQWTLERQYFPCAQRPGWDPDHFVTTPVAELPTRDTFEILGADHYFEPDTDTIMLLDSSVNEAGTPFEDYAPPGHEHAPESPESPEFPESPMQHAPKAAGLLGIPRCPRCQISRTELRGACRHQGLQFSCLDRRALGNII